MTTRSQKIDAIIKNRQEKGKTVAAAQGWIQDVRAGLSALRARLDDPHRPAAAPAAFDALRTGIAALDTNLSDHFAALEKVRRHFAKDNLAIAAVGQARMGKSTFLQSLTGLANEQIPAQSGRACTSTQSYIVNLPDGSGPGYAEVFYYTRQQLLDIFADFYPRLGWPRPVFLSLDAFRRDFGGRTRPDSLTLEPLYNQLAVYASHADALEREIFAPNVLQRRIDLSQVAEFVTYDEGLSRPGNLAVSRVAIHCHFPLEEVGNIAVVDTPGMNAASEERDRVILEEVLCDTADFVLFIGIPSIGAVSQKEREMFDNCRRCAPTLAERAFYVANQARVRNEQGELVRDGSNEEYNRLWRQDFENHVIPAAKLIRVDVSRQPDVLSGVLDPALDYIAEHLPALDARDVDAARATLAADRESLRQLLSDARALFELDVPLDNDVYRRLRALFDRDFPAFSGILQRHLDALPLDPPSGTDDETPTSPFVQCVSDVFERYRQSVGDEFSLEKVRAEMNSAPGQGGAAFFNLLAYLRCFVRDKFFEIENACHGMVEDAKRDLEALFLAAFPEGGGLSRVAELRAQDGTPLQGSDFFFALAELARKAPRHGADALAAQFLEFARFDLTISGFIAHKITRALAPLRQNSFRRYHSAPIDFSDPEAIRSALLALGEEAVNQVAITLVERSSAEPNQAIFAAVENFVDRTLRTRGFLDQWIAFYEGVRADVWPEDFDPNSDTNRFAYGLSSALDALNRLVAP